VAAAFGVVMALAKGQDAGARDAFGNLSAPWIALPFLVGALERSPWRAAVAGLLATAVAFFGFYLAEAFVLDLGSVDMTTRLRLTLGSGHVYEVLGAPAGAAFGALGAMWRMRPWPLAPLAVALVFVTEPLIVYALGRTGVFADDGLIDYTWIYLVEATVGAAVAAVVVRRTRSVQAEQPGGVA
jgi:Family of unknown function (DUF6518)